MKRKLFLLALLFTFASTQTANAACLSPGYMWVTNKTGTSVILHWSAVNTSTQYQIQVTNQTNYPYYWLSVTQSAGNNWRQIWGLQIGNGYNFRVRAYCSNGQWGPWGNWTPFTSGGYYKVGGGDDEISGEDVQFSQSLVSILPNPARDHVNVYLSGNEGLVRKVTLLDLTGRAVQAQSLEAGKMEAEFNLADLPMGVYFIRLEENGQVQTRKLLVTH